MADFEKKSEGDSSTFIVHDKSETISSPLSFTKIFPLSTSSNYVNIENFKTTFMTAPCSSFDSICWVSFFPVSEYFINWNLNSAVSALVTQEELQEYCTKASIFSKDSRKNVKSIQAIKAKKVFYCGILFLVFLSIAISIIGYYISFVWICTVGLFIFAVGIFFLYKFLIKALNKITQTVKIFIKTNENLKEKGLKVQVGQYGKYLSFNVRSKYLRNTNGWLSLRHN